MTLLAGQFDDVGTVDLSGTDSGYCITYNLVDDWCLNETQLWTGTDLIDMPLYGPGNPQIGGFPYKDTDFAGGAQQKQFCLSWDTIGFASVDAAIGQTLVFASHATVESCGGGVSIYETDPGTMSGGRPLPTLGYWTVFINFGTSKYTKL
jgi:hypothetical protein